MAKLPGPLLTQAGQDAGWGTSMSVGDIYGVLPAAVHRMEKLPSISSKLEIQF